tara:strand:+ start:428 stop:538 length:111 start_codon:yes stop_codon:yes gene_type:complete
MRTKVNNVSPTPKTIKNFAGKKIKQNIGNSWMRIMA